MPYSSENSLTNNNTRILWYQLIDSNGNSYNGTSPNALLINADEASLFFVSIFKRKVYDDYANNYLYGIPMTDLLVFQNKTTFIGNKPPLPENTLAVSFGATMEEALVVLVPEKSIRKGSLFSLFLVLVLLLIKRNSTH